LPSLKETLRPMSKAGRRPCEDHRNAPAESREETDTFATAETGTPKSRSPPDNETTNVGPDPRIKPATSDVCPFAPIAQEPVQLSDEERVSVAEPTILTVEPKRDKEKYSALCLNVS